VADLPFFLACSTIWPTRDARFPAPSMTAMAQFPLDGEEKAVTLIEFLPGVSVSLPTPAQAHAVGIALAQCTGRRRFLAEPRQYLSLPDWRGLLDGCGSEDWPPSIPRWPTSWRAELDSTRIGPDDLPRSSSMPISSPTMC
jgi:homoserine kinase type II